MVNPPHSSTPKPKPTLSLKRQLLLWLLLPQILLWIVATGITYRLALNYAGKVIDQSLQQTLRSLSRQIKPMGAGLLVEFPRASQNLLEQDPDDKLTYMVSAPPGRFVLGNSKLPEPPTSLRDLRKEPVLYDSMRDGKPVRVAVMEFDYGDTNAPQRLRVQIAKSVVQKERIATELVGDMLIGLTVLSLILSVVVVLGVVRGLRPLKTLAAALGDRSDAPLYTLAPMPMQDAPYEVHQLTHELNRLLDGLKKSIDQEKRFINNAAHQLRTPLAGVISQTELAIEENKDIKLQERLQKVLTSAKRSTHLVHQLLALARSEAGVPLSRIDIVPIAKKAVLKHTQRAVQAGVDLGFEGVEQAWIMGNALLVAEALTNLLDNALRYAPPKQNHLNPLNDLNRLPHLDHTDNTNHAANHPINDNSKINTPSLIITLSVQINQSNVDITVKDNGVGVSKDMLPHLFDRFWRGTDSSEGAGLGLSIVAEIAQQMGASVQAAPAQPQGLSITITAPLAGEQDSDHLPKSV